MTVRAFLALPLDAAAVDRLADLAEALAAEAGPARVRWQRRENYHLTLKFLGDVEEEVLDSLSAAIGRSLAGRGERAFDLRPAGVLAFGRPGRPRIVAARIAEPTGRLALLAGHLEDLAAAHGVPVEGRAYRPHVTLGRVGDPSAAGDLARAIEDRAELDLGPARGREVVLYRSDLTPAGANYAPLARFLLIQDGPSTPEPPEAR